MEIISIIGIAVFAILMATGLIEYVVLFPFIIADKISDYRYAKSLTKEIDETQE